MQGATRLLLGASLLKAIVSSSATESVSVLTYSMISSLFLKALSMSIGLMSAFFRADIVLYVYCIICTFLGFSSHWSVPGAEVSCTVWTVRLAAHLAHRHKVTQSVTKQTNTLDSEKIMVKVEVIVVTCRRVLDKHCTLQRRWRQPSCDRRCRSGQQRRRVSGRRNRREAAHFLQE